MAPLALKASKTWVQAQMDHVDKAKLEQISRELGFDNLSAILRYLIRSYQLRSEQGDFILT